MSSKNAYADRMGYEYPCLHACALYKCLMFEINIKKMPSMRIDIDKKFKSQQSEKINYSSFTNFN